MRRIVFGPAILVIGTLAAAPNARSQGVPVKPAVDNERVTVWDGAAANRQVLTSTHACVSVRLTPPVGASFSPRCSVRAWGAAPAESVVIELKDHPVPPAANTSGFPNAFPRPGSRKLLENDKVVVWDFTWTTGVPTAMHFHDKDVVVVYLENGALKSTTPDRQSVVNDLSPGLIRFNARDRVHTEELVRGKSRAIITELK